MSPSPAELAEHTKIYDAADATLNANLNTLNEVAGAIAVPAAHMLDVGSADLDSVANSLIRSAKTRLGKSAANLHAVANTIATGARQTLIGNEQFLQSLQPGTFSAPPVAAPQPVQWYVIQTPAGVQSIGITPGSLQQPSQFGTVLAGPFFSQEQANIWAQKNAGSAAPEPGMPPIPLAPTAPLAVPPPPTASSSGYWVLAISGPDYSVSWCIYGPATAEQVQQYLAQFPPSQANPTGAGLVTQNPVPTLAIAQGLVAPMGGGNCVTPGPSGGAPISGAPGGSQPPTTTQPPTGTITTPTAGLSCDQPLYIQLCNLPPAATPTPTPTPTPTSAPVCPPGTQWDEASQSCSPIVAPTSAPLTPLQGQSQPCFTQLEITFQAAIQSLYQKSAPLEPADVLDTLQAIPFIGDSLRAIGEKVFDAYNGTVPAVACDAGQFMALAGVQMLVGLFSHFDLIPETVQQVLTYATNYSCPVELPGASEANECYLQGIIDAPTWQYWTTANGLCPGPAQQVLLSRREKPTTEQLIQAGRRLQIPDEQIVSVLSQYGWLDQGEAALQTVLYDRLPEISDVLQFLTRNVYDTAYVADYQLLEGFDERFWSVAGNNLRAIGITEEVAALHYAAHWINPAPGELREFVYRLRPDKAGVTAPFTEDDYARLLVEMDVSPFMRQRFQQTIYQVPALGYVRDMYRSYLISDAELKSIHRDLGYNETDSNRFVQIDQLTRARMRSSQARGWDPQAIAHGYVSQVLTARDVTEKMAALGYTAEESTALMERASADLQYTAVQRARSRVIFQALSTVRQGLQVGSQTEESATLALVSLGWPVQFAQAWTGLQLANVRTVLVKQATTRVRSEYLSGGINIQQALTALGSLGIDQLFVQHLLAIWQLEFQPKVRRRSAAQIVSDVANGAMDTSEALVRLHNLGYSDADSMLYLGDAQRKILGNEQKQLRLQQRQGVLAANEAAKYYRALQSQQKEALRELERLSSPATLRKWAELGIIGRDLFFERMRTFNYDDSDIERYYQQACSAKGAACTPTTPPTPPAPSGATGSGFPG